MFKSATFLSFPPNLLGSVLAPEHLEPNIAEHAFRPAGSLELQSMGFVPPLTRQPAEEGEVVELVHRRGHDVWLTAMLEERVLPRDVITQSMDEQLKAYRAEFGREPGRQDRAAMSERANTAALAKSFTKRRVVDLVLHLDRGQAVINTSSRKVAETIVVLVRRALGSFPALFLVPETPAPSVLSRWLKGQALPEGLELGSDVELVDPAEKSHKVKATNADLLADEIRNHLDAGMTTTKIGLRTPRASFVLSESLAVSKLKLSPEAITPEEEFDSALAQADATMLLVVSELRQLQNLIREAFAAPDQALTQAA